MGHPDDEIIAVWQNTGV